MYSIKEKLRILREIHNPAAAGADLSLLRMVAPGEPGLVRFGLSPSKHADDILMALLQFGVCREDIVANRRQLLKSAAESQEPEPEAKPDTEASVGSGEQSPEVANDSPEPEAPSESESAPEPSTESPEQSPEVANDSTEPEAKKKSAKSRSTQQ